MHSDQIPTPGPVADSYELIREIAHGGMGVVYRARDTALDRDVAVKSISPRYVADSVAAERFLTEARITAQLQHPGIPAVHQIGTLADGRPYMAMKLIKGSTLEDILKDRPDPAADHGRLLAIFEAVCQAVGYAHAHEVIHRDLKTGNVMVGAFGEVQVMDWGLAKVLGDPTPATAEALTMAETRAGLTRFSATPSSGSHTQHGSMVGTPAFIPPEQAAGEIDKVSQRSDVFGLGALLAVILTGKPPYVGESPESIRVAAVRGKLDDCFARLDASGAEPELVDLCKHCLAFEPADRPADGGAVAQTVAGLRAAADERAQRAELERVRVEGEQATALARSAEHRKRRLLKIGAAAVLAVAVIVGLLAVLVVQRQAHYQLEAKNKEVRQANAQLKEKNNEVEAKNTALAKQRAEVESRFETARKAIANIHSGVIETFLLKNPEFKELRTKLLAEAAGFYSDLEKLLEGKDDAKSRKLLADGYRQLGDLTEKIGDHNEALAVQRKGLEVRRKLAEAPGADVEARLEVVRSLGAVGLLLDSTGDTTGSMSTRKEMRDLAAALEAEAPTDAVRMQRAHGHYGVGIVLAELGKPDEALEEYQKALAIMKKLADANRARSEYQSDLAACHNSIGDALSQQGKPAEALEEYQTALAIQQELARTYPAVTKFLSELAVSHRNIALVLAKTGKPDEALKELKNTLDIRQKLADDNPAVTDFQRRLANCHNRIGLVLRETGKPAEALLEYGKALAIMQKLAEANSAVTAVMSELATSHNNIGEVLSQTGKPGEAIQKFQTALEIMQKLADANRAVPEFQSDLATCHNHIGAELSETGKPDEALQEFQKALAIMQKLVDSNPASEYQSELAACHNDIGEVLSQTGKPAEALKEFQNALAVQQKLAGANPAVTEFQSELALSHRNIALVLAKTGKPAEALEELQETLAIRQKLADPNPTVTEFQSDLAASRNNIGEILRETGKPDEALEECRKGLAIAQKLADATPSVTEFQRLLANSHNNVGGVLAETGKPAEALEEFQKALAISRKLVDASAAVTDFQNLLAVSDAGIGACLLKMGRLVEAAEASRKASDIMQKLVDDNPANTSFRFLLVISQNGLGRVLDRQRRSAEAFSAVEKGLLLGEKLVKAEPENPGYNEALGDSYAYRGGARARAGSADAGAEAAADLRRALELWAKPPHRNGDPQFEQSRALALLAGLGRDTKSGVTKEEAKEFAERSVAALAAAVKTGRADPSELKEPDFDALRGRDDFTKLLAELEAKSGPKPKPKG